MSKALPAIAGRLAILRARLGSHGPAIWALVALHVSMCGAAWALHERALAAGAVCFLATLLG